jgi:hypothetical protein
MQLKADILYNSIYVMTKYLYKACFTDYIRCQWESIFTVRELREFCGNAFSLRESRPVLHLKFLIPLPPVPAGFPRVPRDSRNAGLPFGALINILYVIIILYISWFQNQFLKFWYHFWFGGHNLKRIT